VTLEDAILGQLRKLIVRLSEVPERPVRAGSTFDELGLDSVDRLELLVAIEDEYGIALPDDYLSTPTVGGVADAIRERLEDGSSDG
jgi:acyl carrier protein